MADNVDIKIVAGYDGSQAIKGAEETGKKVQEALDIKTDNTSLLEQQKLLQKSVDEAQNLRESLDASTTTYEKRAGYAKLEAEQLEKSAKLTELIAEKNAIPEVNKKLQDKYKDFVREHGKDSGWATRTLKQIETNNTTLAQTEQQIIAIENRISTLTGLMGSLKSRNVAFTKVEGPKLSDEERVNAEQRIVELEAEQAQLASEITERYAFLADTVEQTVAGEVSSTDEFERAANAVQKMAEAGEQASEANPTENWEEGTLATKESVEESKKEFEELGITGEKASSEIQSGMKGTDNEIYKLLTRISDLKSKIKNIETGKTFATPEEYIKLNAELAGAKTQLNSYRKAIIDAGNNSSSSSKKVGIFAGAMQKVKASLSTTLRDMGAFKSSIKGVGNAISSRLNRAIKDFRSNLKHLRTSLKRGLTTITKYVLGFRSLYFLVRKLRNAVKAGMENLAQYNDHLSKGVKSHNLFNDAMNDLQTHLLYLKNAWAAAFSPIVIKVMPILTGFIEYLAVAGNAIAKFIAELTGQDTAYNAVKVQAQDYADSLDNSSSSAKKATQSAKKLQQQLASYDKLDVIKSNDDDDKSPSGGGGGGSQYTPNVQDMFKTITTDSEGLAKKIKDAFDKNDFYGLGQDAAQAVKDGLDSIQWDDIQTKVGSAASGFGQFVNGFLGNTGLWQSAGATIGNAINTVTTAIDKFLDPIDSVQIGYNASAGLRKFLTTTDWEHLGSTIKKFFDKVTSGLQSFVDNFPSEETTQAILDFFKGLDLPSMIPTTIKLAVTGVVTAITVASGVIQGLSDQISDDLLVQVQDNNFDFTKDGKPVTMQLEPKADWTKNPLLAYIDSTMTRNGEFWVQMFVGGDLDKTVAFADAWERAWHAIEAIAGLVGTTGAVLSLPLTGGVDPVGWVALQGAIDGIKKVIADNPELVGKVKSFKEAVDGVAEIFGKNIVTGGLYSGIQLLVSYFKDPELKKSVDNNPIIKALQGIAKIFGANVATGGLYSAVQWLVGLAKDGKFGENIKKFVTDPIGTIKTNFNFENVRKNVQEKWNTIKGYFVGENSFLYKIRTKITETKKHINDKFNFENVRKSVKDKWDKIKGYFVGDESILTKIKKRFEDIKFKNPFEAITDAVESAKKAITGYDKQAAKTGWQSTQKVHVKGLAERLEDAFEGIVKALPTPIKDALKKVQDFINNLIDGINYLSGQLNKLKISGTNPFTGKAYSYGFSIPHIDHIKIPGLAQGAVIPPNKEFMAVLGDQKQGTNIEAPLDTMVEAFEKALDSRGGTNHDPIVLQLNSRVVAQAVWDEETKKYKQTGFGLAY